VSEKVEVSVGVKARKNVSQLAYRVTRVDTIATTVRFHSQQRFDRNGDPDTLPLDIASTAFGGLAIDEFQGIVTDKHKPYKLLSDKYTGIEARGGSWGHARRGAKLANSGSLQSSRIRLRSASTILFAGAGRFASGL